MPEPEVGCLPPPDVTLPAQVLGHPDLIKRRPKESLKPGSNASNCNFCDQYCSRISKTTPEYFFYAMNRPSFGLMEVFHHIRCHSGGY